MLGRARAQASVDGNVAALHSRPGYYGSYVFIWTALPAILFMVAVLVAQPFLFRSIIDQDLRSGYTDACALESARIDGDTDADVPKICQDFEQYETLETRRSLMEGVVTNVANGLELLNDEELTQIRTGLVAVRPTMAKYGVALAENVNKTVVNAAFDLNEARHTVNMVLIGGIAILLAAGFACPTADHAQASCPQSG